MSQRLRDALSLVTPRRPLLIGGLVAADPYPEATPELMAVLAERGADTIEIVLPFSHPLFHGAVIQRACARALVEGFSFSDVCEIVRIFRSHDDRTPVILSSYTNCVLRMGMDTAMRMATEAGIDALMLVDMPWRESGPARKVAAAHGVAYVPILASTSTSDTLARVVSEAGQGALCVWSGHAGHAAPDLATSCAAWRAGHPQADELVLVAAGNISTPEEAADVVTECDGVLVGSALSWIVEGRGAGMHDRLGEFVGSLRDALDRARAHSPGGEGSSPLEPPSSS